MRARRRWRWSDVRTTWGWGWIASGAAILVVVAGFVYLETRTPGLSAINCRAKYSRARTAADTARVDGEMVWRRASGKWNCGMLRRTGATDPGRR